MHQRSAPIRVAARHALNRRPVPDWKSFKALFRVATIGGFQEGETTFVA